MSPECQRYLSWVRAFDRAPGEGGPRSASRRSRRRSTSGRCRVTAEASESRVQAVLVGLPALWATAAVRRPRLVSAIRARLVLLRFVRTCFWVLGVDVLQCAVRGMLAGMSDALPGTGDHDHDHDHDGPGHGHETGASAGGKYAGASPRRG